MACVRVRWVRLQRCARCRSEVRADARCACAGGKRSAAAFFKLLHLRVGVRGLGLSFLVFSVCGTAVARIRFSVRQVFSLFLRAELCDVLFSSKFFSRAWACADSVELLHADRF